MGKRRRTRYDIYADVLATVERWGLCGLTRISYGAGIPLDRAKRVVGKLVAAGFLMVELVGGRRLYGLTVLGATYLELYRRLKKLMEAIEASQPHEE